MDELAIPPIRRRLYQQVADHLERLIQDGALAEGVVLPSERELMDRFSVGRPAIREALLSLQQKGLVAVSSGERARVTHPDAERLIEALSGAAGLYLGKPDGVRHFQATRRLVESAIARDVAIHATDDDLAEVTLALEANRAALGDPKLFEATDVRFHSALVACTRNPLLIGMHRALAGWLSEQREVSLRNEGAERSAFAFHERIHAAVLARDGTGAEAAMREHLLAVEAFYWGGGQ